MPTLHEQRIQELEKKYSFICNTLSELEKTLAVTVEPLDRIRYQGQITENKKLKYECEQELRELGVDLSASVDDKNSLEKQASTEEPYKGLRPFDVDDKELFFGREVVIQQLFDKLENKQRFIAILGASGSGKSSLAKAGLIAKLKGVQGNPWKIITMFPTHDPLQSLTVQSRSLFNDDELEISDATVLHNALKHLKAKKVLLLIDQFEEVFTRCNNEQSRSDFFRCLLETIALENSLCVVITLRADFLGKCADYAELASAIEKNLLLLKPLNYEELQAVIEKPLQLTTRKIESELTKVLISDALQEKNSLPLLQYALEKLWEETKEQNIIRLQDYQTLCKTETQQVGLRLLLNEKVQDFYKSLEKEERQQKILQWLLLELTQVGDWLEETTRKTLVIDDLLQQQPDESVIIQALLKKLVTKERLLVTDSNAQKQATLTIAHEALIREWAQFREWLKENLELKRWRDRIANDLKDWERTGKTEYLLHGGRLQEAEEKLQEYSDSLLINAKERKFIQASQVYRQEELVKEQEQLEQKQRRDKEFRKLSTRFVVGAIISVLVAFILSGFSVWQYELSEKNRIQAEQKDAEAKVNLKLAEEKFNQSKINQSLMLIGFAEIALKENEPSLAMRLALEAFPEYSETYPDRPFVAVAYNWLSRSINRQFQGIFEHEDDVSKAIFSPDGTRLLTASGTQALVWDIKTGQLLLTLRGHSSQVWSANYSPDGTRIVTASEDKTARVWDAHTGQAILTLKHNFSVISASYSPDGTRIITAFWKTFFESQSTSIGDVWDAQTGQAILTFQGYKDDVSSAAYSPDSMRIVTTSKDNIARVWDALTGKIILTFQGHERSLNSATYSPDGTRIVTASGDKTARVWDAQTGKIMLILQGHKDSVTSAVYSLDGTRIVTASFDKTIRVWDALTGQSIITIQGHKESVLSAVYNPNGVWIATASRDKTARVWNTQTGQALNTLSLKSEENIISAIYSCDGKHLVTTSGNDAIRSPFGNLPIQSNIQIWDTQTEQLFLTLENQVLSAYNRDRTQIITTLKKTENKENIFNIWDIQTGELLFTLKHEDNFDSINYSPNGAQIIITSKNSEDNISSVWDARTGKLLFTLKYKSLDASISYNPDNTKMIVILRDIFEGKDNIAEVLDAQTGQLLFTLKHENHDDDVIVFDRNYETYKKKRTAEGYYRNINSVTYSPDGKQIVTAAHDKTARVWDAQTGQLLFSLQWHEIAINTASYSQNSKQIITTSSDKIARVWDAQTGQLLFSLQEHENGVNVATYSPDGKQIVTVSDDKTARVWNAQTGKLLFSLQGHESSVGTVTYSPDGKQIITTSSDKIVRVWNAQTGRLLLTTAKHENYITPITYSEDGLRIITISNENVSSGKNIVYVWDIKTGEKLAVLPHEDKVDSAQFSPDGLHIVTTSGKVARIWLSFLSPLAMVEHAKKMLPPRISEDKGDAGIANFRLTCEERRQFFLEELERCKQ